MTLFALFIAVAAPARAQAPPTPVEACARRLAEAARAEFPSESVALEGAIKDPGERLDYFGAAILREARKSLSAGAPSRSLSVAGTILDRDASIVVAVNLSTGSSVRAAECSFEKGLALAGALREELESRRAEHAAEAERYAAVLRRGVWKEGPAFPQGQAAAPPEAKREPDGWSFAPQAGVQIRGDSADWNAGFLVRSPSRKWENGWDFGEYSIRKSRTLPYFEGVQPRAVEDHHQLNVRYVRTTLLRRWEFEKIPLPGGRVGHFPGAARVGAGLGLYHLNDDWRGRDNDPMANFLVVPPPSQTGGEELRVKPHVTGALSYRLGGAAEITAAVDYVLLTGPMGPPAYDWGGASFRALVSIRLF